MNPLVQINTQDLKDSLKRNCCGQLLLSAVTASIVFYTVYINIITPFIGMVVLAILLMIFIALFYTVVASILIDRSLFAIGVRSE